MFKVFNKTYQPIRLIDKIIPVRGFIFVEELTQQIKNIEKKGLLNIKKVK